VAAGVAGLLLPLAARKKRAARQPGAWLARGGLLQENPKEKGMRRNGPHAFWRWRKSAKSQTC